MKFNVKKQECPKNIQIVFKYSKKKTTVWTASQKLKWMFSYGVPEYYYSDF